MSRTLNTPYFVMYREKLMDNLEKLQALERRAGVHILHTVKSFNQASILPTIAKSIGGMSVSSPKELEIAKEAKAEHIHLYAPAFKEQQLKEMLKQIDTISFNSLNQWRRFKEFGSVSKGIRINPKLHLPIPNHCNPNLENSRLGVDTSAFLKDFHENREAYKYLDGLHFHALFQSSEYGLTILLEYILENFKALLPNLKWLNLGGGHNFTNLDYKIDSFCKEVDMFRQLYPKIELYFEPGESVTKGSGEFVSTILDIVKIAGEKVAILDTSIETHLLDVAIVNMRLSVKDTERDYTPYFYRLEGNSCIQGDFIGEYFFKKELQIGDKVVFENMMGYTMVKMTEFNGMERASFYFT